MGSWVDGLMFGWMVGCKSALWIAHSLQKSIDVATSKGVVKFELELEGTLTHKTEK